MSADLVIQLFETIRLQRVAIPETLKNLLEKLLHLDQKKPLDLTGAGNVVDDIFLPLDIVEIIANGTAEETLSDACKTSESEAYKKEIQTILEFNASDMVPVSLSVLKKGCDDNSVEKSFNLIILELMSSDILSQEEYRQFVENLREQTEQFMWTGQYAQILQIIHLLRMRTEKDKFTEITSEALEYYYSLEFYSTFIDSLKIMGRQARDEAWKLCEYFGKTVISRLMDALVNEDSQAFRSLLMSLLKQFGDKIVPHALKRLDDARWFVKRNMLYLLSGCKNKEIVPYVKPYCHHENCKVSFEAIKCLLNMGEGYGFEVVKESLLYGSKQEIEQAITLLGAFRVREAVPDLIQMLMKNISKADLAQRVCIIRALGNIGDPRSLEAFREILSTKSLFFRKGLKEMKEEICRALRNYPYQEIKEIIQLGLQHKDEYIKNESLRLSRMSMR
jgi:HEAT repeat protein